MYLVFYHTSDVFEAEELLQNHGISTEIVPTPVQDKAYCDGELARKVLINFDYKAIQS